jgi:hypothetical protein
MVYTFPTAPPEIFHKWSAISAVAGALQRRVYVQYDTFRLYPNMYNILIGPPGSMKTSAMRIGQKLLTSVPGIGFSVDSISREKLILDLTLEYKNGQSAMTAYCSEFSSFFSTSGPEMAVFLTDIYESPDSWSHKVKTGASSTILNACLNLQGCTTPETMAKSLPIHVVGLGLTSRTVFVHASNPRERDWRGNKSVEQDAMREHLMNDLQVIATMTGEYNFTPDADAAYNSWYKEFQQNLSRATKDDRLKPYYSRKHTHIIKLCMILSAMRRDSLIMTITELNDAHALLRECEQVMGLAFMGFGASATATPMAKITEILYYHGDWMPHGVLLDMLKHDVRRQEFDECIETLVATKAIEIGRQGSEKFLRTTEAFNQRQEE